MPTKSEIAAAKRRTKEREFLKKTRTYMVAYASTSQETFSASYNRDYELIAEGTWETLKPRAKKYYTQISRGFKLTLPEQQPSWANQVNLSEVTCVHLYKDFDENRTLKSIPC